MAEQNVGRRVVANLDGKLTHVAWVNAYEAGRDEGDHYVCGFTPAHHEGDAPYFGEWMQDSGADAPSPGQFRVLH